MYSPLSFLGELVLQSRIFSGIFDCKFGVESFPSIFAQVHCRAPSMSDYSGSASEAESDYNPKAKKTPVKRKSEANDPIAKAPPKKRARASKVIADPHADAKELLGSIIADEDAFPLPKGDEGIRSALVQIARYAKSLEREIIGNQKTPEQIEEAAVKLRHVVASQIRKAMTVSPAKIYPFASSLISTSSGNQVANRVAPSFPTMASVQILVNMLHDVFAISFGSYFYFSRLCCDIGVT